MSQADVERRRREVQSLQKSIASESSKAASERAKESKARLQASKASTSSSGSSRLRESQRHGGSAEAAEKKRAQLEAKLAKAQQALHGAEETRDRERDADHKRALRRLEQRSSLATAQFRPTFVSPVHPEGDPADGARVAYDVFISHASEDKLEVAAPLADLLIERGLHVWYDDRTLTIGDSLRRRIDEGLAASRFGVVILSPDFFRKEWPQAELDGLVTKQRAHGGKTVLPIWHHLAKDDVLKRSPTLADLVALNTAVMTLGEIANEIVAVVQTTT